MPHSALPSLAASVGKSRASLEEKRAEAFFLCERRRSRRIHAPRIARRRSWTNERGRHAFVCERAEVGKVATSRDPRMELRGASNRATAPSSSRPRGAASGNRAPPC